MSFLSRSRWFTTATLMLALVFTFALTSAVPAYPASPATTAAATGVSLRQLSSDLYTNT